MEAALTAFVICFREGCEVLLILFTLIAITKRPLPVYIGAAAGIALNVGLGIAAGELPHSAVSDNAIMLLAAALMLYMARGVLLWQFSGMGKKAKLQARALHLASNPFALSILALLVVGREVFELFLFTEALTIHTGGWTSAVFAGIGVAAVCLAVVYSVLARVADRLPMRTVFVVSSIWLVVQAGLLLWDVLT